MWPFKVIKVLPFTEFIYKFHIIFVGNKLVKFLLIGKMLSFCFPIQLRRSNLDVRMLHTQIFNVPVKLGLELMTTISPDEFDAKGKFLTT
jgi:hypothetical protein